MYADEVCDILVFRTNITGTDVDKVAEILNADFRIRKWNIDCGDIDHVLRVEADQVHVSDMIQIVRAAGFICEELPD